MTRLEYQTIANCNPDQVWQVFADLNRWSQWNPVIGQSYWISGEPWKLGSKFFMEILQPRRMTFKPVINEISAPNRVAWTGKSPGFKGTHWHEFIEQPDGTTLIKTWEEFSGFGTLFLGISMRRQLLDMYAVWINALGREAEMIANSSKARS